VRPIDRGPAPRAFANYRDAQPDLCTRLGYYCSYCERWIETHLAVEHVQPKSLRKALQTSWDNFLLGCVNCNSCKGKKAVTLKRFVWPDTDNTARAFRYESSGEVLVMPRTRQRNRTKAEATLRLVGLDRVPGHADRRKRPSMNDMRWRRRQEAFVLASRQLTDLAALDNPTVRQLIVDAAVARGMFSIWMQVCVGDSDMRRRLIAAFVGTAASCFHTRTCRAVKRRGGCM
jgi:uncharacterized protein (TIGR02646 family)